MKQKKIVLVVHGTNPVDHKRLYKVEKTFNLMDPFAGEVLTTSQVERYIQNSQVEVEIKTK